MEKKFIIKDNDGVEVTLPDGKYFGMWTGFTIDVRNNGIEYQIDLFFSRRSTNIPVDITIENGIITFEQIK